MRKIYFFVAAIFVIMAVALGWFLPLAAFNIDDKINEGKQQELEIERVNLTYRDDLTIAQKIEIVNNTYQLADTIELDKGIFLTEEEVIDIISEFLADFTGHHYDLHENDYLVYATPMLVNLTGNRGTTVIWSAEFYIPDGWYFSCAIDDKTGAILKVNFSGYGYNWDSLIFDFASAQDPNTLICDKYRNAIYNNYSKRLNAKFVTYHLLQDTYDYDYASYVLIFRDGRNETFEINLGISVNSDYIESY
ncbi:MAG: hypothetical protein IKF31_08765 [Clostridiales bacterium]|nr:hypothetical protein [Clostridiales bacterium]